MSISNRMGRPGYTKFRTLPEISAPHKLIGVEITIAAATLTPVAQIVSKTWVKFIVSLVSIRLALQDLDFVSSVIFIMAFLLMLVFRIKRTLSKATKTSAAAGFEPAPTTEDRVTIKMHVNSAVFKCCF